MMIRRVVTDPLESAYLVRHRLAPKALVRRHARRARQVGIDRLYLLLSFDCDTPEDAAAAVPVHERLARLGVRPAYAVPGELLERDAETYRELASDGAEFLNHGYAEHTFFDPHGGEYLGGLFYDRMGRDEVRADIVGGHRALQRLLGKKPRGFRAPHFGTFQRRGDLRFLHRVLGELGYGYSSSTVPIWGLRMGPVFTELGVRELPVTGRASAPLEILDSWSCFAAPDRTLSPAVFRREAADLADTHAREGAGLLNLYVDPAHVRDRREFFDAVSDLTAVAQPIGFSELLSKAPS